MGNRFVEGEWASLIFSKQRILHADQSRDFAELIKLYAPDRTKKMEFLAAIEQGWGLEDDQEFRYTLDMAWPVLLLRPQWALGLEREANAKSARNATGNDLASKSS